MLNLVDLERRWVKYKIKSYIPHLTILISIVVISTIVFIFVDDKSTPKSQDTLTNEKNITLVAEIQEEKTPPLPEIKKPIAVQTTTTQTVLASTKETQIDVKPIQESKKVQLEPSLDFLRQMQNSMQPYYKNETKHNTMQEERHHFKPTKEVQAPKVEVVQEEQVVVQNITPQPDPKKITIQRRNTQNDIFEIIARFKKNNNPALSLFIAKKYYELGDYEQAYNYALITNKINKEIESSWIIFTKSLVKLGRRKQAIETLKQYIKQSHSSAARILLDEIHAGKFQ